MLGLFDKLQEVQTAWVQGATFFFSILQNVSSEGVKISVLFAAMSVPGRQQTLGGYALNDQAQKQYRKQ